MGERLQLMLVLIVGVIIIYGLSEVWRSLKELRHFRRDELNPFRRFCVKCGQQQDLFTYDEQHYFWEDAGSIKKRCCSCHQFKLKNK